MEQFPFQIKDEPEREAAEVENRCTECGVVYPLGTLLCPSDGTLLAAEIQAELGQNYRLRGLIGQGGMAVVVKADHVLLHRTVAIKMLLPHLQYNDIAILRFQQEATTISALEHPNIVRIYDFNAASRSPFLVMEFIEAGTLEERIKVRSCLTVTQALPLFKQICRALQHVHDHGVLHRDLKPSNVLVARDRDGNDAVKLVDFGLAKLLDHEQMKRLSRTGDIKGSPLYMSPEQCVGEEMTAASDVYSLGCLMYETVTGVPAFEGESALHTMYLQMNEKPPSFSQADVVVHKDLQEIIFKCLEKDPRRRYSSAKALLSDLTKFEAGTYRRSILPRHFLPSLVSKAKYPLLILSVAAVVGLGFEFCTPRKNAPPAQPLSEGDRYINEHLSHWRHVKRIDLANKSVTSAGVKLLAHLPELSQLSLVGPKIDDDALEVLSDMPKLQVLDLSDTAITDAGLSRLLKLRPLRELRLKGCRVTDRGISSLATLPYLSVLSVEDCKLELDNLVLPGRLTSLIIGGQDVHVKWGAVAVNNLANLVALRQLYLLNNEVVPDSVVRVISRLPALSRVSFKGSYLPDSPDFSSAEHLIDLDCESARIKPQFLTQLPPHVQRLIIKNIGLRDVDLAALTKVVSLRVLELGYNGLTDDSIIYLIPLKNLEHLELSSNDIGTRSIAQLQALPRLSQLLLYKTKIDDQTLATLAQMKQLQWLGLAGNRITAAGVKSLIALPNLLHLELDGTALTSSDLDVITKLSGLRLLTLSDQCVFAEDGSPIPSAISKLQRLPALQELMINGLKSDQASRLSSILHCTVSSVPD